MCTHDHSAGVVDFLAGLGMFDWVGRPLSNLDILTSVEEKKIRVDVNFCFDQGKGRAGFTLRCDPMHLEERTKELKEWWDAQPHEPDFVFPPSRVWVSGGDELGLGTVRVTARKE